MAPPSQPTVANLDCEGTWSCDTSSCSISFTQTQAQSGSGQACPAEPSCSCTNSEASIDANPTSADEPAGLSMIPIAVICAAGAAALCLGYAYLRVRRRRSSVVIDQTTYEGKQPSTSRRAPKGKRHGISPGTPVQVYSKSKGIWCQGTVVRMVNREAAEVAYHPGSRRDKEPRRKVLRMDSENLRWNTVGRVP